MEFELEGRRFLALNGGAPGNFTVAVSFMVDCADQEQVDRYWSALTDGGAEGRCGWLKDRYGVSWQIIPSVLGSLIAGRDPDGAQRAMQAMLGMQKLDIGCTPKRLQRIAVKPATAAPQGSAAVGL